jgi:hypothetical protein
VLAVYHPSVATVYSLLREPSLAFLWTHSCTFYVRPFPSRYLNRWTGARHTLDANLEALETGSPLSKNRMPEARFPKRPSFSIMKGGGCSSEATAVDRDLTVTQVNNCEQLE